MSAKTDLIDLLLPQLTQKIERDYWRIEGFHCWEAGGYAAHIQGRRRMSEPFWPGLRLDWPTLQTFGVTMRNAATIAAGFCGVDHQTDCVFPNSETVAICQGSQYVIETSESLDGFGKQSISTTVFQLGQPILPAVYLIDEELRQFAQDIETLIERLTRSEKQSTVWQPPQLRAL